MKTICSHQPLSRFWILTTFLACSLLSARAQEPFTKTAMLENLARTVIIPAYSDFAARCRDLVTASEKLCESPDTNSLDAVQAAWSEAMLAWRPAQVVRAGPLLDQDILSRIHFWPIRRQSVEKVLADKAPITDAYIRRLGAPAVGLCAMEFLLFDLKGGDAAVLATFRGAQSERRKTYLKALAADLLGNAERVLTAWNAAEGGYKTTFVAGGQDSVNLIVNDMLQAIEIAAEERLKYAIFLHEGKLLRLDFIQGAAAGISQRGVAQVLRGGHRLFSGGGGFGLVSHLRQIKSPLADRIEVQFQLALKAVDDIGAPLEKALLKDPAVVKQAYEECKKLEIALKVELVSALGVTLTFNSTDGD